MKGYVDTPANKDLFQIGRYVNGLSQFIAECDTPMTIAIQGDWGSGKTSLMNMVSDSLQKAHPEVVPIWFNTWQFSQFNLGDQLPIMMVTKLINSLGGKDDSFKTTAKKVLSQIGGIALAHFTNGGTGIDDVNKIVTDITDGDLLDQFENLRETFQNLVNDRVRNSKGRVVFFIDDLDRLNPGKAVELLEVLKIFLECENCVFVLAIDYNVVVRGIREKYGDIDEEKGKAFFDKIIQVPFRMPLEHYKIFEYVTSCLDSLGIQAERFDVRTLDILLMNSVGNNPRSIKRIFNSYLLLKEISDERVLEDPKSQILLFAVLCMQNKFPKLYSYIVMQRQYITADFINVIENAANAADNPDKSLLEDIGYSEDQFQEAPPFYHVFYKLLDSNHDGMINEDEIQRLKDVLGFSDLVPNTDYSTQAYSENENVHRIFWERFREIACRGRQIKPEQMKFSRGHCVCSLGKNFRLDMSRNLNSKKLQVVLYIDLGDRNKSKYQFRKVETYQTEIEAEIEDSFPETEILWDHNNKKYPRVTFSLAMPDMRLMNNAFSRQTSEMQYEWFLAIINACNIAIEGKMKHE